MDKISVILEDGEKITGYSSSYESDIRMQHSEGGTCFIPREDYTHLKVLEENVQGMTIKRPPKERDTSPISVAVTMKQKSELTGTEQQVFDIISKNPNGSRKEHIQMIVAGMPGKSEGFASTYRNNVIKFMKAQGKWS